MAKVKSNGFLYGLLGNLVLSSWKGRQIFRIRPRKTTSKASVAQKKQRATVKLVSKFCKDNQDILRIGYQDTKVASYPLNEARKYHFKNIVTGNYPKLEIDYSKVKLSRGMITPPLDYECSVSGSKLAITWNPAGTKFPTLANDEVVVSLYYPDIPEKKENARIYNEHQLRKTGSATFTLPQNLGNHFHAWMFFSNPLRHSFESQEKISDSVYLGEFNM